VDRRGNNVRWRLAGQLDNVFAQIRFDHFIAILLQMRIEMNLLGRHRLALDDDVRVDVLGNASDDLACLSCVVGPMHLHTHTLRLGGEVLEVLIQARYSALLDGACLCAQFFGIAQGGHGGHTARHEVGDQQLQGLLQGGILERLPGVFLKAFRTEMLGSAARRCMACYGCGHGLILRAQMPAPL
jgi:hypothetical protein